MAFEADARALRRAALGVPAAQSAVARPLALAAVLVVAAEVHALPAAGHELGQAGALARDANVAVRTMPSTGAAVERIGRRIDAGRSARDKPHGTARRAGAPGIAG